MQQQHGPLASTLCWARTGHSEPLGSSPRFATDLLCDLEEVSPPPALVSPHTVVCSDCDHFRAGTLSLSLSDAGHAGWGAQALSQSKESHQLGRNKTWELLSEEHFWMKGGKKLGTHFFQNFPF